MKLRFLLAVLILAGMCSALTSPLYSQLSTLGVTAEAVAGAREEGVVVDESAVKALAGGNRCSSYLKAGSSAELLERYFVAKAEASRTTKLTAQDVQDFSCSYVATSYRFNAVRFKAGEPVALLGAESDGVNVKFSTNATTSTEGTILLPTIGDGSSYFTVKASTASGGTVTWTGSLAEHTIDLTAGKTTKGSEVYVESEPSKATVYLNNKEWYETTNTAVVRDPGELEVRIVLPGYQEWVQKRKLKAGETWKIKANLSKKNK